jgi:hypothetical protein
VEGRELIHAELEKAAEKKKELQGRLRELEAAEPKNFNELWRVRDQLAYWEGKHEGLTLALEALK